MAESMLASSPNQATHGGAEHAAFADSETALGKEIHSRPTPQTRSSTRLKPNRHNQPHRTQQQRGNLDAPGPALRILRRLPLVVPVAAGNRDNKAVIREARVNGIYLRDRVAPESALNDGAAGWICTGRAEVERGGALEEEVDGGAAGLGVALGGAVCGVVGGEFGDAEVGFCGGGGVAGW
ncbi:hypothetical protein OPT61_g6012 [Boeremia exigua]|uniref:Uncharacterized protein n=1 Tax=Boeremia exigua TaxID=749465 RepID=A0ACC2I887_9PLEO|nr:hypothetical protein OPT61_g6012 [Boeremia exigua]